MDHTQFFMVRVAETCDLGPGLRRGQFISDGEMGIRFFFPAMVEFQIDAHCCNSYYLFVPFSFQCYDTPIKHSAPFKLSENVEDHLLHFVSNAYVAIILLPQAASKLRECRALSQLYIHPLNAQSLDLRL